MQILICMIFIYHPKHNFNPQNEKLVDKTFQIAWRILIKFAIIV